LIRKHAKKKSERANRSDVNGGKKSSRSTLKDRKHLFQKGRRTIVLAGKGGKKEEIFSREHCLKFERIQDSIFLESFASFLRGEGPERGGTKKTTFVDEYRRQTKISRLRGDAFLKEEIFSGGGKKKFA